MLGVILCGGKSSRMGEDKGLMRLNSTAWAQIAADKLSTIKIPAILSVSAPQFDKYALEFPNSVLVRDKEEIQIKGPVCGILSVHINYPEVDLLVLACDMLMMEPYLLEDLFETYQSNPGFDNYAFTSEDQPEPLCGIYTADSLKEILQVHQQRRLHNHSVKFILEQGNSFHIEIPHEQKLHFQNINMKEDIEKLW